MTEEKKENNSFFILVRYYDNITSKNRMIAVIYMKQLQWMKKEKDDFMKFKYTIVKKKSLMCQSACVGRLC